MFCAKTHNMGFVSLSGNKTPIVPLQGAALRDRALPLTQPLQAAKKGLCSPLFTPVRTKEAQVRYRALSASLSVPYTLAPTQPL